MRFRNAFMAVALAAPLLLAGAWNAGAHPHVWVVVETDVLYDAQQAITGFRHKWTFDDAYSSFALTGLDKNNDGKYDRAELQELAEVNASSLKEFDFFTFPTLASKRVDCLPPKDYYLEYADNKLSLFLTLPLRDAVPAAKTAEFRFGVYDPTYYIDFAFAKQSPVKLAGAPHGCSAVLAEPDQKQSEATVSSLSKAPPTDLIAPNPDAGLYAKSVHIKCPAG